MRSVTYVPKPKLTLPDNNPLMNGRRTSPRQKPNPLTPFRQETFHPLQNQTKRFTFKYEIDDPRKYHGQPQRYAFSPAYSAYDTEKNIKMERLISPPSQFAAQPEVSHFNMFKTNVPREAYSAPNESKSQHRIHRFMFSPTPESRRATRELHEPSVTSPMFCSEPQRLARKEGAGRMPGFEEMQKNQKHSTSRRAFGRAAKGKQQEKRTVENYDRLDNMYHGWHENRIKNMSKLRSKYTGFGAKEHKHRFRQEFPHVGPQNRTVMKHTPKSKVGENHTYSIRFDEIGIRRPKDEVMMERFNNRTKKYASIFWDAGMKDTISKAVQLPNQYEKRDKRATVHLELLSPSRPASSSVSSPKGSWVSERYKAQQSASPPPYANPKASSVGFHSGDVPEAHHARGSGGFLGMMKARPHTSDGFLSYGRAADYSLRDTAPRPPG